MNKDRELNRLAKQNGVKRADRKAVAQYASGIDEGVRIACRTVAKRLLGVGWAEADVGSLLCELLPAEELADLIDGART